jgi:hypothetical protein
VRARARLVLLCGRADCDQPRKPGAPLCAPHWAEVDPGLRERWATAVELLREVRLDILAAQVRAVGA